jgi:8-oxo-dGTP pyrophosphatase MutT (NUDIX family)
MQSRLRPPRVTSTRVVYENRWMRVHEDRTEREDGTPGLYGWIEKPPAAIIVPIDAGHVWLVEQFRHPVGRRFWEFPQGAWEDDPDASAEELARGELAEETGLRAARLELLGTLYFAYGITDQTVDVWRATGLEPGEQALEETEHGLVVRRFTVAETERMVHANEVRDAASVAAWHLATTRAARSRRWECSP